jgi:hypothetical protein
MCLVFVSGCATMTAINVVSGMFHWHNPSDRTMALGLMQPLTEMSTRNISWGQSGRCVGLTTLTLTCAIALKSGSLNLLEPTGPVQACNGIALPLRHVVVQLVEALRYKREGRGFDSWWCHWNFSLTQFQKVAGSIPDGVIGIFHWHQPSGRTMALGLTQPLT